MRAHTEILSALRTDSMKEEQCRVLLDNSGHGGWPTFSAGPQRRGYYREMGSCFTSELICIASK
jgi:hypothetical protein